MQWRRQAVMIRNHVMLWTLSIGFELMELTFQHLLPNFNECWWDRCVLGFLPRQGLVHMSASNFLCTVPFEGPWQYGAEMRGLRCAAGVAGCWTCSSATGWASGPACRL